MTPRAFQRLKVVEDNLNEAQKLLADFSPEERAMILALDYDLTQYKPVSELQNILDK
ncbi:hypothetical protein EWM64_g7815 [Hericium alpestre]|uniref:Uncharacterized protein n=1 Tax=Hericium alpestre TaxID=135208 RepID=A0A4Y9ZRR3_9AGAM|nr:hypothetical protein EWM64_g7815 [Hericium alpestre]